MPSGERLLNLSFCSPVKPEGADELEELEDELCPQAEIPSPIVKINTILVYFDIFIPLEQELSNPRIILTHIKIKINPFLTTHQANCPAANVAVNLL